MPEQSSHRGTNHELCPIRGVPDFWNRTRRAAHTCLLLDYDGTLAPFRVERMHARPLPGISDALRAIIHRCHTTVVIVSGRPVSEVRTLLPIAPLRVIGSHGYELSDTGNSTRVAGVSVDQAMRLDTAYAVARQILDTQRVERKVASVAAHFRGLSTENRIQFQHQIESAWRAVMEDGVVELRQFDGGSELRALGRNKGTAVRDVLGSIPEQTFTVYVGDDETDEDAFAVVRDCGVGIRVGSPTVRTSATGHLENCEAVLRFLKDWQTARSCV